MKEPFERLIEELFRKEKGFELSGFDKQFFANNLKQRMAMTGITRISDYYDRLVSQESEKQSFQKLFYNSHSQFFRNPASFHLLEEYLSKRMVTRNPGQEIRIWSAACAAGQEPYSIAIVSERLETLYGESAKTRIFGSDISQQELEKARAGIYELPQISKIRIEDYNEFFEPTGEKIQVGERIRRKVEFYQYDLLDPRTKAPPETIFSQFDIIFCCNLLYYYKEELQRFILGKFAQCLVEGGLLMTDELSHKMTRRLTGFREMELSIPGLVRSMPADHEKHFF